MTRSRSAALTAALALGTVLAASACEASISTGDGATATTATTAATAAGTTTAAASSSPAAASSAPASTGGPTGTPGGSGVRLPAGFPVPPGARVTAVSRRSGETAATLTVTDGTAAYQFWKRALPGAGYRITRAAGAAGAYGIQFSGPGGDSEVAITGSQAAVRLAQG